MESCLLCEVKRLIIAWLRIKKQDWIILFKTVIMAISVVISTQQLHGLGAEYPRQKNQTEMVCVSSAVVTFSFLNGLGILRVQ